MDDRLREHQLPDQSDQQMNPFCSFPAPFWFFRAWYNTAVRSKSKACYNVPMTQFKQTVLTIIASIPKGKVMSYGQIAAHAGSPRAARQVGGILRASSDSDRLPWWRVLNNEGRITIKGNWFATKELQKSLLEKEGIIVNKDFKLDIERYRFRPKT
jgi:methylated-DNA-protein-cysteine methyltransferase-like protein